MRMYESALGVSHTWVHDAVLVVVVREVGVGAAGAPRELQHRHAGRADVLPQLHHIRRDDAQVLRNDGHLPQLLHMIHA